MKPNELRLGNYIQDVNGKLEEVESLHCFGGDEINQDNCTGKYSPVKLTNYMLTDVLGFTYDYVFYTKGALNLVKNRNGNYTPYIHTLTHGRLEIEITYLHDIQNLYHSSTGNELTLSKPF